ncbi:MAG: tRNA (N(6)-L-threonylcarbamoyladenosine(37)-C(2))-methylthiotransferase MtaB [Clostridia bacterium]
MKVVIITLGCKVNLYESEAIAKALTDKGVVVTNVLEKADAYVINTCAVTNEAESKSREYIAKINKIEPHAKIFVCGCSVQNDNKKFLDKENVVCAFGTANKIALAELIIKTYDHQIEGKIISNNIATKYEDNMLSLCMRTRGTIKIQDGCNSFCSYCIIPYVRGRSRSRSIMSIKNEINLLSKVTSEIVIAGVNLTEYGKDLSPKQSLSSVVLLFKDLNVRFRLGSLEAGIITEDFLKTLKTLPNFCDQFHLSMQSGSTETLSKMNRHYTAEEFACQVALIRKYFPQAGITTDLIVGFPTEDDRQAEETYNLCKQLQFSDMHIFKYSKRSGTVASKMTNVAKNVPERVKSITKLAKTMKIAFLEKNIDREDEVLLEKIDDEFGYGYSKNYIECIVPKNENMKHADIIKVKMIKVVSEKMLTQPVI